MFLYGFSKLKSTTYTLKINTYIWERDSTIVVVKFPIYGLLNMTPDHGYPVCTAVSFVTPVHYLLIPTYF